MNTQTLWVPFSVLNSPSHNSISRLIWLLLGLQPAGAARSPTDVRLGEQSGLNLKTIAAARARLAESPLGQVYARPHSSCAEIPAFLLTSTNVSPGARLLYGQLQGAPDFQRQGGSFTYASLSRLTGCSDDALRRAVAELVAAGWLAVTQANRKSPLCFKLRNPASAQLLARISAIRRRVRGAPHRCEALLREFLDAIIDVDDYKDNAAPDLLLNPFTGELMEFDRYYPAAAVAVEFNGDQHYEETDLSTFEETVKQVGRDAMKTFICKARGIELVIIRPEDLSLKAIEQKIPGRLPRRDLKGLAPLVAALEGLASEYRERTAERRARNGRRPEKGNHSPV